MLAFIRHYFSPTLRQVILLFLIDMGTNVVDYAFHFYLGWVLQPTDFAIVQTVNSALLVAVTVFGMNQPAVARLVATAAGDEVQGRAIFQTFLGQSSWLGLALVGLIGAGRGLIASWLNVPPMAVAIAAAMLWFALTRPVVAGMLQARQQFWAYGGSRTVYAVSRLGLALILLTVWTANANLALITLPLGALAALLAGLWALGGSVWRRTPRLARNVVVEGWRLSLGALVAYGAFMFLQSVDVIWVNRMFAPEDAAAFSAVVLFRRLLAVLPGAVVVIMYPRAAALVAQGQSPARLLRLTTLGITLPTLLLTLVYFAFGDTLMAVSFGGKYLQAAPLLGWMGVAMLGHGLVTMWLNFFLVTRPLGYVVALVVAAAGHLLLLTLFGTTLARVTLIFGLTGLLLTSIGLGFYGLSQRRARPGKWTKVNGTV